MAIALQSFIDQHCITNQCPNTDQVSWDQRGSSIVGRVGGGGGVIETAKERLLER